jgi:hypothetical protein
VRGSRPGGQAKPRSTTVGSRPSGPWTAAKTSAQSSAERAIGPSLSMLQASAIAPCRLMRPKVGRSPVAPQRVQGETMLPQVSDPSAKPTSPAAVADAEPAEEPLDPCSRFHGFFVVPPNQTSPQASAPRLSFATSTAPASSSLETEVASSGRVWSR